MRVALHMKIGQMKSNRPSPDRRNNAQGYLGVITFFRAVFPAKLG